MSIYETVSINGTEIEFIKAFVSAITAHDGITCDTDIDEQFSSTSNTPQITINIGDTGQIVLTRVSALGNNASYYIISAKIKDYSFSSTQSISYSSTTSSTATTITREYKFSVISNSNIVYVAIYSWNNDVTSASLSNSFSYLWCRTTDFNLATACSNRISYTSFNKLNFVTDEKISRNMWFASRLQYQMPSDKIEIIKNKAILSGTTGSSTSIKINEFSELYDCSNITANTIVTIEETQYYALDNYTLIKIGE